MFIKIPGMPSILKLHDSYNETGKECTDWKALEKL
jgi:hypothetical protein